MKELLRTSSLSMAESLHVALDAHDIPAFVNQNLASLPPAAITVVVNDADFERGLIVLRELQQPGSKTLAPSRRLARVRVLLVVGAFLVLCASLY